MGTKKRYEVPQMTVVVVKSERGYVVSDHLMLGLVSDRGDRDIEYRQEAKTVWGGGGEDIWNY